MKRLYNRDESRTWVYDRLHCLSRTSWLRREMVSTTASRMINTRLRFRLLNVYSTCLYFEIPGLE